MRSVDVRLQPTDNYIVPLGWVFWGRILNTSGLSICTADRLWSRRQCIMETGAGIAQYLYGNGWEPQRQEWFEVTNPKIVSWDPLACLFIVENWLGQEELYVKEK